MEDTRVVGGGTGLAGFGGGPQSFLTTPTSAPKVEPIFGGEATVLGVQPVEGDGGLVQTQVPGQSFAYAAVPGVLPTPPASLPSIATASPHSRATGFVLNAAPSLRPLDTSDRVPSPSPARTASPVRSGPVSTVFGTSQPASPSVRRIGGCSTGASAIAPPSTTTDALFDAMDKNGDGVITRDEMAAFQSQARLQKTCSYRVVPQTEYLPGPVTVVQRPTSPAASSRVISRQIMPSGGGSVTSQKVSSVDESAIGQIVKRHIAEWEAKQPARIQKPSVDEDVVGQFVQRYVAEWESKQFSSVQETIDSKIEMALRNVDLKVAQVVDGMKDFTASSIEDRVRDIAATFEEWNLALKSLGGSLEWQQVQIQQMEGGRRDDEARAAAERDNEVLKRLAFLSGEVDILRANVQNMTQVQPGVQPEHLYQLETNIMANVQRTSDLMRQEIANKASPSFSSGHGTQIQELQKEVQSLQARMSQTSQEFRDDTLRALEAFKTELEELQAQVAEKFDHMASQMVDWSTVEGIDGRLLNVQEKIVQFRDISERVSAVEQAVPEFNTQLQSVLDKVSAIEEAEPVPDDTVVQSLDERLWGVQHKTLPELSARLRTINDKMAAVEECSERLAEVEKVLPELRANYRNMDDRIVGVEKAFPGMHANHQSVSDRVTAIEQSLPEFNANHQSVADKVSAIEEALPEFHANHRSVSNKVSAIEQVLPDIRAIHQRMDERILAMESAAIPELRASHQDVSDRMSAVEQALPEVHANHLSVTNKVSALEEVLPEFHANHRSMDERVLVVERALPELHTNHRSVTDRVTAVEEALPQFHANHLKVADKMSAVEEVLAEFHTNHRSVSDRLSAVEEVVPEFQANHQSAIDRVTAVEEALPELHANRRSVAGRVSALEEVVPELHAKHRSVIDRVTAVEEALPELHANRRSVAGRVSALEEALPEFHANHQSVTGRVSVVEEALPEFQANHRSISDRVLAVEKALPEFHTNHRGVADRVSTVEEAIKSSDHQHGRHREELQGMKVGVDMQIQALESRTAALDRDKQDNHLHDKLCDALESEVRGLKVADDQMMRRCQQMHRSIEELHKAVQQLFGMQAQVQSNGTPSPKSTDEFADGGIINSIGNLFSRGRDSELWKVELNDAGTKQVMSRGLAVPAPSNEPRGGGIMDSIDRLFSRGNDTELWKTELCDAGTAQAHANGARHSVAPTTTRSLAPKVQTNCGLRVTIVSAQNLQHMNFTGDEMWCQCRIRREHSSTSESCRTTAKKSLNPEWNETFDFHGWQVGEPLEFTIYDKGMLTSKTEGVVVLASEQFFPNGAICTLPVPGSLATLNVVVDVFET